MYFVEAWRFPRFPCSTSAVSMYWLEFILFVDFLFAAMIWTLFVFNYVLMTTTTIPINLMCIIYWCLAHTFWFLLIILSFLFIILDTFSWLLFSIFFAKFSKYISSQLLWWYTLNNLRFKLFVSVCKNYVLY